MAIFVLLGNTTLLENRYSPVIAVKEEIAWEKRDNVETQCFIFDSHVEMLTVRFMFFQMMTNQNSVVKLHSSGIFKDVL